MEYDKNIKYKVIPEFVDELRKNNPEYFEIKTSEKKISLKDKPFTKVFDQNPEIAKIVKDKIGMVYVGYLLFLFYCMHEDNSINFNDLTEYGVSISMIENKVRKHLKEVGLVKKFEGRWYINPLVGVKKQAVNKRLIDLFQSVNREIYRVSI